MTPHFDLHSHSTASDGTLSPTELVERAKRQGVTHLALTDHDTTDGLAEARVSAEQAGVKLIPGIELSANWQNRCVHIVGLDINPDYAPLAQATRNLQAIRLQRAEKIALKLEKKRIPGALDAVKKKVGNGMITRSHFADFLLASGYVSTQQEAFDRYLAKGKPAYVATPWAELRVALDWINQSGGIAVLAHPLRYQFSSNLMKRLLTDFKADGGRGIEIITGRSTIDEIQLAGDYARRYQLAGSVGSDFHTPQNQYVELGRLNPLPADIEPVWSLFAQAA